MTVAKNLKPAGSLTPFQIKELALSALVDERTLKRALKGRPGLGMVRERIRRTLEARGLAHLLPEVAEGAR